MSPLFTFCYNTVGNEIFSLSLTIFFRTMNFEISKALVVLFLFEVIEAENLNETQPFVVNGTEAYIEEFPFMV